MKFFILYFIFLAGILAQTNVFAQCACCSSVGCGDLSGDNTTLVKQGKFLLNASLRYVNFKTLSKEQLIESAADTTFPAYSKQNQYTDILSATYGISNRWNVGLSLPYNSITGIEQGSEIGGEPLGNSSGLSNMKFTTEFVLLQMQKCDGWEFIARGGLILPTGKHNIIADNGDLFEDQFQPGAKGLVPLVGGKLNKMFGQVTLNLDANYIFAHTDVDNNTDAPLWNANFSVYYPLNGMSMNMQMDSNMQMKMTMPKVRVSIFAALQAEGVGQDIAAQDDGERLKDPNTGLNRFYAAIGAVANVKQKFFIPVSVAVPFAQQINGFQSKAAWRLNAGVGMML
jgi:hypothetical protein